MCIFKNLKNLCVLGHLEEFVSLYEETNVFLPDMKKEVNVGVDISDEVGVPLPIVKKEFGVGVPLPMKIEFDSCE